MQEQVQSDVDDVEGEVFCIGSLKVTNKLRMEDESKSVLGGQDVIIGMATKHQRTAGEACAICYYDSAEGSSESELEREFSKPTVLPVGRYAGLCICSEVEPTADNESGNGNGNGNGNGVEAYTTPVPVCGHTFHTGCLYKWLKADTGGFSCPICRGGLEKQKLHPEDIPMLYASAPEFVIKYWPNGKMKSEHFEVNKVKHGICKTYTSAGQLECKCNYKNGRKNGTEAWYYPESSTLKSTTEYLDDIKHGFCQRFSTDGRQIGESQWSHGKRSGRNIEWYTVDTEDGQPRICSLEHHREGERHGIAMKWGINGKLIMYGVYNMGQRSGRFCAWFEQTGALRLKEYYVDGIREGRSVEYYDIDQHTLSRHTGTGGTGGNGAKVGYIKELSWFASGMPMGPKRLFWSNGVKKLETDYNDIGHEDGVHREWNRFGKLCKVLYYDDGKLDGVCQAYEPTSGQLLETETYHNGVLHGLSVQRYKGFGNTPRLVRMFQDGAEVFTRHYTRQGRIVWERLPDGTVNNPAENSINVRHKQNHNQTRPRFNFR